MKYLKPYPIFESESKNNLNDNFFKWFGNSQVVDSNGQPLIMYHGSCNKFDKFDRKKIKYLGCNGDGFYLTKEEYYAKTYGENVNGYYLRIENPLTPDTRVLTGKDYENIIDYINKDEVYKDDLKNYGFFKDSDYLLFRDNLIQDLVNKNDYISLFDLTHTVTGSISYLLDVLRKNGHTSFDGIVSEGFGEWVIFNPNNIKSIDNDGTWDLNDSNIYS